jgi:hypothetical protein
VIVIFMLRWDQDGFDKIRVRTRYAKLVFLHSMGAVGNVVHSNAFGA